jgi:hypothetical protein
MGGARTESVIHDHCRQCEHIPPVSSRPNLLRRPVPIGQAALVFARLRDTRTGVEMTLAELKENYHG